MGSLNKTSSGWSCQGHVSWKGKIPASLPRCTGEEVAQGISAARGAQGLGDLVASIRGPSLGQHCIFADM